MLDILSPFSIKYGTIIAFSQKQIHLSHQTTYLYNFFTQKNIFNFNKHADQWIYQLLCYNFCHKPVLSRDRRQSSSVHCRVKLLSVYGGSVPHCPLLAAKMMTKPSIYRSYNPAVLSIRSNIPTFPGAVLQFVM